MVPGRQEPGQPEGDPVVTSHVVDSGLLRTMSSALWTVTCAEYPYGVVRLENGPRLTQVVVGDDVGPGGDGDRPVPFAAASCTAEGEVVVVVRAAPPAIAVTAESCWTRPHDGAERDSAFPQDGERLILLSCAVFEAVPDVLVDGVNGVASGRLATDDPESLLIELVGGVGCGAGAIIDHHQQRAGGHR